MSYDLDDIIEHYGVKGMKWGVRKKPEKKRLIVGLTENSRNKDRRPSYIAPGLGGMAIHLAARHAENKKINKAISTSMNTPIKDIDKKSLKTAREAMKNYTDLRMAFEGEDKEYNIVEHYGVKGMKWGVRRAKDQVQSAKRERSWGNKDQSKLSDQELKTTVDRLQNEAHMQRLTKQLSSSYSKKSVQKALKLKVKESKELFKKGHALKREYYVRNKLSDSELKARVDRLNLEGRFDQLSTQVAKGQKKQIDDLLKTAGELPMSSQYSSAIGLGKMLNEIY